MFRIFLAQQRSAPEVALVTALLQRWLAEPPPADDAGAAGARRCWTGWCRATQLRFPVVGDLARSVRFRWFDQPLVDAERADVLAGVRDELDAAGRAARGAPTAPTRIDALAAIPEQIVRFLGRAAASTACPRREPMLEVLVRRHYREYDLHDLRDGRPSTAGRSWSADYTLDDRAHAPGHRRSARSTSSPTPHGELAGAVADQVADRRPGHEAVVDLYLHWPDAPESTGGGQRALAASSSRRCRSPARYAGSPSPSCAGGGAAGRLLHLPPAAGRRRWPRTTWSAACTRWSAAG